MYTLIEYIEEVGSEVLTGVNMFQHTVSFLRTSIADMFYDFEQFDIPAVFMAFFTLMISLAVIDKLRGR